MIAQPGSSIFAPARAMGIAGPAACVLLALAVSTLGSAGGADPASPIANAGHRTVPSQCATAERILYSCEFPRGVGSLCAGGDGVHYRYGPLGKPRIDLASLRNWSNVRSGYVRGQGNGYQRHVRVSRGHTSYVIYEGANGDLSDSPGIRYSGIAVLDGENTVATLSCPGRSVLALDDPLLSRRVAEEATDGPFDAWF